MEPALFNPAIFVPFVAITSGAVIAVTAIIVGNWSQVRRTQQETELKQEMLQLGMSADEIVRVVQATSGSEMDRKREKSRCL
jgi:cytochrome bd-type quinol oxidase subunit 1